MIHDSNHPTQPLVTEVKDGSVTYLGGMPVRLEIASRLLGADTSMLSVEYRVAKALEAADLLIDAHNKTCSKLAVVPAAGEVKA